MMGTCREYGSQEAIFDQVRDKALCKRFWKDMGVPMHNIEHPSGFQRERKVISCHT